MSDDLFPTNSTPVVFERDGKVFANSRDVAAFFEKQHSHVMQELRRLAQEVGVRNPATPMFIGTTFSTPDGQSFPAFDMTRDGFTLLAMGFTGSKALTFKLRYIDQFNAMEEALKRPAGPDIPNFSDPAAAARAWADEFEARTRAQTALAIAGPKAEVFDKIAATDDTFSIRDAGKTLGMGQKEMFGWLSDHGYIFRQGGEWRAYQDKIDAGLFTHKVRSVQDGEKSVVQCRITAKGVTVVGKRLKRESGCQSLPS